MKVTDEGHRKCFSVGAPARPCSNLPSRERKVARGARAAPPRVRQKGARRVARGSIEGRVGCGPAADDVSCLAVREENPGGLWSAGRLAMTKAGRAGGGSR